MVVVDTSVLIDFFNGTENQKTITLERLLNTDRVLLLNLVKIELLQGCGSDKEYRRLEQAIKVLEYRELNLETYCDMSIQIYRKCRKSGVTIRKTIDTIIGAYCIKNDFEILENDSDYLGISKVFHLKRL